MAGKRRGKTSRTRGGLYVGRCGRRRDIREARLLDQKWISIRKLDGSIERVLKPQWKDKNNNELTISNKLSKLPQRSAVG